MSGDWPMMPSKPNCSSSLPRSSVFWARRKTVLSALVQKVRKMSRSRGFFDEVEGPALDRGFGGGHVAVGGDHNGLGVGLSLPRRGQDLHAVVVGVHLEVGHDQVEVAVRQLVLRLVEAVHQRADVAQPTQRLGHDLGVVRLVVDHQHRGGNGFMLNTVDRL